jgi:hypothetical protein
MSVSTSLIPEASDIQSRIDVLEGLISSFDPNALTSLTDTESVLNDPEHSKFAQETYEQASKLFGEEGIESSVMSRVDDATRPWRKARTNDKLYKFTAMCSLPDGTQDVLSTYGRRNGHRCASATHCMTAFREGHLTEMQRIAAGYWALVNTNTFKMQGTTIKEGHLVVLEEDGHCKVVPRNEVSIGADGDCGFFQGRPVKIVKQ